jgi:hypothetical protein
MAALRQQRPGPARALEARFWAIFTLLLSGRCTEVWKKAEFERPKTRDLVYLQA